MLACLARDEGLDPPITGQYLSVAALLPHDHDKVPEKFREEYKSRFENVNDPVLKLEGNGIMGECISTTCSYALTDNVGH